MLKSFLFLSAFLVLALSCSSPVGESPVKPMATPSPTPTKDEVRLRTQEQMLRGENQHDGASTLYGLGTIESVPALLKVIEDNPPDPNGVAICTTGHAIDALKKITGANPGDTYKEWKSWWDNYQRKQRRSK